MQHIRGIFRGPGNWKVRSAKNFRSKNSFEQTELNHGLWWALRDFAPKAPAFRQKYGEQAGGESPNPLMKERLFFQLSLRDTEIVLILGYWSLGFVQPGYPLSHAGWRKGLTWKLELEIWNFILRICGP
jgi:hypothetical protein